MTEGTDRRVYVCVCVMCVMCGCVCVTDETRPLTVGYISPDLYTHSVSYYAEAPITHHDSKRVNVIWYCVVPHPDARTRQLCSLAIASGATWKVLPALPSFFVSLSHRLATLPHPHSGEPRLCCASV